MEQPIAPSTQPQTSNDKKNGELMDFIQKEFNNNLPDVFVKACPNYVPCLALEPYLAGFWQFIDNLLKNSDLEDIAENSEINFDETKIVHLKPKRGKINTNDLQQEDATTFDNSIGLTDVSEGADMAKRLKQRVTINGKDQWITGETHQDLFDAYLKKAQEEGFVMQKTPKKKDIPTMREFIEKVYKPNYIDNLGAKTVDNYMQYINLNILPFMGDMRLDEINVTTIQQFYDWMANASSHGRKKNLNRRSIERISGFLGRIFKVALDMKIIDDHPIKKTLLRINAEAAGHHKALSDDEIARVKEQIPFLKSEPQRLYMALLAYTGMRPEEVLGLMWEDVHLNCKKPHALIMRAVTYPGNSKAHIGPPKTEDSARTVILSEKVVKILSEVKKDHGFICGGGRPWCYSTKERHSSAAFKTLGIEDYTDYDFRTTFGTQLKESGVSSAIIADLMGHADTRMVETVYARARHEGILKQYDAIEKIS